MFLIFTILSSFGLTLETLLELIFKNVNPFKNFPEFSFQWASQKYWFAFLALLAAKLMKSQFVRRPCRNYI